MKKITLIILLLSSSLVGFSQETILTEWDKQEQIKDLDFQMTNIKLKSHQQVFIGIALAWVTTAIITNNNDFYLNAGFWGSLSLGTSIAINTKKKRFVKLKIDQLR